MKIPSAPMRHYLLIYAATKKQIVTFSHITYKDMQLAATEKSGDFL
jgi:hypothetical protein